MCKALEELMADVIEEREKEAMEAKGIEVFHKYSISISCIIFEFKVKDADDDELTLEDKSVTCCKNLL